MKTVKLTKSEIETLGDYLLICDPCESTCIRCYKRIGCLDTKPDGTYKCRLMRDVASIEKKLGLLDQKGVDMTLTELARRGTMTRRWLK